MHQGIFFFSANCFCKKIGYLLWSKKFIFFRERCLSWSIYDRRQWSKSLRLKTRNKTRGIAHNGRLLSGERFSRWFGHKPIGPIWFEPWTKFYFSQQPPDNHNKTSTSSTNQVDPNSQVMLDPNDLQNCLFVLRESETFIGEIGQMNKTAWWYSRGCLEIENSIFSIISWFSSNITIPWFLLWFVCTLINKWAFW